MRRVVPIFLFLVLIFSCKKESYRETTDFGYNYQPNKVGYWIEYEVDSITFDNNTNPVTIDTAHYFIREVFDTTYTDASNNEAIRVEQYRKNLESDVYQINYVGNAQFTTGNFQRNFHDLRYMALTFPVREGNDWQGNIFIDVNSSDPYNFLNDDLYNWTYTYTEVDVAKEIGGFSLDSCVVVQQIDEANLFEMKYAQEIYARNIGMVYKEMKILNTQVPPSGVPFEERAESGFILTYTLKDYQH
ncbi:MAG: hypothetical protein R2836_01570 [Chitinophagales bacterium]